MNCSNCKRNQKKSNYADMNANERCTSLYSPKCKNKKKIKSNLLLHHSS